MVMDNDGFSTLRKIGGGVFFWISYYATIHQKSDFGATGSPLITPVLLTIGTEIFRK